MKKCPHCGKTIEPQYSKEKGTGIYTMPDSVKERISKAQKARWARRKAVVETKA